MGKAFSIDLYELWRCKEFCQLFITAFAAKMFICCLFIAEYLNLKIYFWIKAKQSDKVIAKCYYFLNKKFPMTNEKKIKQIKKSKKKQKQNRSRSKNQHKETKNISENKNIQ